MKVYKLNDQKQNVQFPKNFKAHKEKTQDSRKRTEEVNKPVLPERVWRVGAPCLWTRTVPYHPIVHSEKQDIKKVSATSTLLLAPLVPVRSYL